MDQSKNFPNQYWDKDFLNQNPKIKSNLELFMNGGICNEFRAFVNRLISTTTLSDSNIAKLLPNTKGEIYHAPLKVTPDPSDKRYLRKDGSISLDPLDNNNAKQYTWVDGYCSIRLKPDGLPNGIRRNPHFTMSVLIQPNKPDFTNEAAKISIDGSIVPPAPTEKFGFAKCNYKTPDECEKWIKHAMDMTHIDLPRN